MRITPVNNFMIRPEAFERQSFVNRDKGLQTDTVSFTSLKLKNGENDFSDTSFYRDIHTLMYTAVLLRETFPQGTDIMDFASSNGEEAISLYTFLNDDKHNNYKFHCYDKSEKAVELGRKGIYSVFNPQSFDYFLLPNYKKDGVPKEFIKFVKEIKRCFYSMMKNTEEPNYQINDPDFIEALKEKPDFEIKYYELKNKYKKDFDFKVGDIKNIDSLKPQKQVGAILFRNAMYIETGNLALNQHSLTEDLTINKKKIIEDIVDKVYDKLLPGGLFILGDCEREHLYIADESVKDEDKIFIKDYGCYIYKKPPLWNALAKDGRFEPVVYSKVSNPVGFSEKDTVPTVWRKII